jgi:hypothetical protein
MQSFHLLFTLPGGEGPVKTLQGRTGVGVHSCNPSTPKAEEGTRPYQVPWG